jgi:hypothetical protein
VKNTYSVQKHRGFSEDEILYFMNAESRKEALKYGQEIFFEKGGRYPKNTKTLFIYVKNTKTLFIYVLYVQNQNFSIPKIL